MRIGKKIILLVTGAIIIAASLGAYIAAKKSSGADTIKDNPTSTTADTPQSTSSATQNPGDSNGAPQNKISPEVRDKIKNSVLVTQNEQYQIRHNASTGEYFITLYAIINRPEQYSDYQAQLRLYKKEALEYLTKSGTDTSTLHIHYEPQEAANL